MSSSAHVGAGGSSWLADVLVASTKDSGAETRIEAVRCVFTSSSAEVLSRKAVMILANRREIVHASLSEPDNHQKTFLCFTERHQVVSASGVHRATSGLSSSATNRPLGNSLIASGRGESLAQPVVEYQYKLWVHVVSTDVFMDGTGYDKPTPSSHPNALPADAYCQVGYMLRPEPRGPIYWLRACDHSVHGLQIRELQYNQRKNTLEGKSLLEWNLAQHQLWHQWDPFTQRLMFWAALPYYKFRIVRMFGHPEKRRCEFEQNIGKLKYPLFPGRPIALPWGTAHSTSCVNYHISVVPVRYECDTDDFAMCRQLLPSSSMTSSPENYLSRIICVITLLRNMIDTIEVEIDLKHPLFVTENYRVTFLFLHGMIAIYLPNVFVHYVDVHHRESPPRYLFGVNLQRPSSSDATPHLPSPRGGVGAGSRVATALSSCRHSPATVPQCGSADTKQHQITATPAGDSRAGSGPDGSRRSDDSSVSHPLPLLQNTVDAVVALPVPCSNWVFTPDTTAVRCVDLRKAELWHYIGERLDVLSQTTTSGVVDATALHHALHVVTSHLPLVPRTPYPNSAPGSSKMGLSAQRGEGYFANNLRRLIVSYWREIRPSFLTQLIIGEAYQATRLQCRGLGNPYFLCCAMSDDRALAQLIDDHQHRQRVLQFQRSRAISHVNENPLSPSSTECGLIRCDSKRELDSRVKEICHNTEDVWWITRGIKQTTSLIGRIKALGKPTFLQISRITLSDGVRNDNNASTSSSLASTPSPSGVPTPTAHPTTSSDRYPAYGDIIRSKLLAVGVPLQQAQQVSMVFDNAVSNIVDEILEIVSKPDAEVPVRTQFHFLHHVSIALHMLGFRRLPPELVERFALLAANTLPIAALLHGVKSHLYHPPLPVLLKAFSDLNDRVQKFGCRYGQKLSERDFAAAEKTQPVPLCVSSNLRATTISKNARVAADGAGTASSCSSTPPRDFDHRNERSRRRPDLVLPRYDREASGVRRVAALHCAPKYDVYRQWALMSAVQTAADCDRSCSDAKEFVLSAFEVGPMLQLDARGKVPRDVDADIGNHFAPWKQWASAAGRVGGPNTVAATTPSRSHSAASREGSASPGAMKLSAAAAAQLQSNKLLRVTDTMKRERATESLQHALRPFV